MAGEQPRQAIPGTPGGGGASLRRVFDSLEASFDAKLARAEDEAASDLALSLLQDATLGDDLRRGAWVAVRPDRPPRAVVAVAEDYVVTEDGTALRFGVTLFAPDPGGRRRPLDEPDSFLELLRRYVRGGETLEVVTTAGSLRGRLARACEDHVALVTQGFGLPETLIPMSALEEVQPGSSD